MNLTMDYTYFYRYISGYNLNKFNWSPETLTVRDKILQFKNGIDQSWVQNIIINTMFQWRKAYPNLCLVCLPASTSYNNERRWKCFSENVSKALGIANGFPYIRFVKDGTAKHLSETHTKTAPELEIDSNFFANKRILLVDDIITTGSSANSFASNFTGIGEVIGLFAIARTLFIRNNSLDGKMHPINKHPLVGNIYEFEEQPLRFFL